MSITVFIGLLVGLLAVGLARLTEGIINYKNTLLRLVIHSTDHLGTGVVLATLLHVAYSVILVVIGSGLVREDAHGLLNLQHFLGCGTACSNGSYFAL